MPNCGTQIILCDLPVHYDTYSGCSHACQYCFANRKKSIADVTEGEALSALVRFIKGERSTDVSWCDFRLPIHWGGMSDPFQPCERTKKRSLDALRVFAETKYPFVVSTKNALIAEEPYLSLIKECDCVVQFSALCEKYDAIEKGASTFAERMQAAENIAKFKRVNIRCQPYLPHLFRETLQSINTFHDVGAHGCIFEAMKYFKAQKGTIKIGGDHCYPTDTLKPHFMAFKNKLHSLDMKFYCGENRLRSMSDELCCCGVEGMGWQVNTANLNHMLFDKNNVRYTLKMHEKGTASCLHALQQNAIDSQFIKRQSYAERMAMCAKDKGSVLQLMEDKYRKK